MDDDPVDTQIYQAVKNDRNQHSIWPAARELPPGWQPVGPRGPKQECLDYIGTVWTDIRPRTAGS